MKRIVIISAALANLTFAFAQPVMTPVKAAQQGGQLEELFEQCDGSHLELHEYYDEMNTMAYGMDPLPRSVQYRYGRDLMKNALTVNSCDEMVDKVKFNVETFESWK